MLFLNFFIFYSRLFYLSANHRCDAAKSYTFWNILSRKILIIWLRMLKTTVLNVILMPFFKFSVENYVESVDYFMYNRLFNIF